MIFDPMIDQELAVQNKLEQSELLWGGKQPPWDNSVDYTDKI